MKRIIFVLTIAITFSGMSSAMDIKGNVIMETRFSLSNGDLLYNQENGSLKFEQQVDDNFYGTVKLNFKYYNNPAGNYTYNNVLTANELGLVYSVQPLELAIDEAYFTYSDFLIDKLDLTAGKQRIAWGTADRLNPTDLLNPNDYSDPFDFGKKIPTAAVNLVYHIPAVESGVQFVYEPFAGIARENLFMYSQIKNGIYENIISGTKVLTPAVNDISGGWSSETALTPALNASNFNIGVKVFGTLAGFDLSASYISRINDMPYVSGMGLRQTNDFVGQATTLLSKGYELGFYREQVAGFDFSKDLNIFLLWGEMAVTFPGEQKTTAASTNTIIMPIPGPAIITNDIITNIAQTVISNEPYVKYTIGFDKSFDGGWYINFQYNHGFFNERGNNGPERLQDYFLLRVEEKVLGDKLKFALTGLADINNLYDLFKAGNFSTYLSDNYGVMGGFSVTYSPHPSVNVEAGVIGLDGKETTSVGRMKDSSYVYTKFEYSF
jgi:hypothetical protein